MIEIYIDNKPVYPDFSGTLKIHDENPLFTKSGSFSYDLTIPLSESHNATQYQWINRINSDFVPDDRPAKIVEEGKVILDGKEIVLEKDARNIKIQIVGGNSELNYSGKQRLKELDLGEIAPITADWAKASLSGSYESFPGVCCPVLLSLTEKPKYPQSQVLNKLDNRTADNLTYMYPDKDNFVLQPYFLTVFERVLTALGWTIKSNVLRSDEVAKRLICVHGFRTRKINEMIPNWEINTFLSEVEKFFNVVIVCDSASRTVSVYRTYQFYQASSEVYIIDDSDLLGGEDAFRIKLDEDADSLLYTNYYNVEYDLPSDWYYNYADISEELLAKCSYIDVASYTALITYSRLTFYDFKIFNVQDMGAQFIQTTPLLNGDYTLVNSFSHVITDKDRDTISFSICPAEVLGVDLKPVYGNIGCNIGAALPYARNKEIDTELPPEDNDAEHQEDDPNLKQWILEGMPDEYDSSNDNLFVACYIGIAKVAGGLTADHPSYPYQERSTFPQCVTYPFLKVYFDAVGVEDPNLMFIYAPVQDNDLRPKLNLNLPYRYEQYYSLNTKIDTQRAYEISFLAKSKLNPMAIFKIAHRKFYCRELVYQIEAGKRSPYVTGTFYPAE